MIYTRLKHIHTKRNYKDRLEITLTLKNKYIEDYMWILHDAK